MKIRTRSGHEHWIPKPSFREHRVVNASDATAFDNLTFCLGWQSPDWPSMIEPPLTRAATPTTTLVPNVPDAPMYEDGMQLEKEIYTIFYQWLRNTLWTLYPTERFATRLTAQTGKSAFGSLKNGLVFCADLEEYVLSFDRSTSFARVWTVQGKPDLTVCAGSKTVFVVELKRGPKLTYADFREAAAQCIGMNVRSRSNTAVPVLLTTTVESCVVWIDTESYTLRIRREDSVLEAVRTCVSLGQTVLSDRCLANFGLPSISAEELRRKSIRTPLSHTAYTATLCDVGIETKT